MSLIKLFFKFFKFGVLAFGGPISQINMLKEELVDKEKWITNERFKKTLALYQALPGPEATEMCVYFGMVKKGKIGAIIAGIGFILPGFLLMLLIAIFYDKIDKSLFLLTPPVILALIYKSCYKISISFLDSKILLVLCIVTAIANILNINFLLITICAGIFYVLHQNKKLKIASFIFLILFLILFLTASYFISKQLVFDINLPKTTNLLVEGLKGGMLTFGGAYTAIPFLQESLPTIPNNIFLDSIFFANLIPAPLIIFATFLGYYLNGIYGALIITFGIFLPAFLFTLLFHNLFERVINLKSIHNLLSGITASVVSFLWVSALSISFKVFQDVKLIPIFLLCLVLILRFNNKFILPIILLASVLASKIITI